MELSVLDKAARSWLKRIADVDIPQAIRDTATSGTAMEQIQSNAKQIMNTVVYGVPQGKYRRTMALLKSVVVGKDENGDVVIGLDAERSPTIAGSMEGENSYGIFMLPELAGDSFFKGAARDTLPRPFLDSWQVAFSALLPRKLKGELDRRIK